MAYHHGPINKGGHFFWNEVERHGPVPFYLVPGVKRHARRLEILRARVNKARKEHHLKPTGIKILSWYRPSWYNRQIGGARFSKHILAIATDVSREEVHRLTPWDNGRTFDRIANDVFKNGGFGQYPSGSRHVDSRGYRARWTSY